MKNLPTKQATDLETTSIYKMSNMLNITTSRIKHCNSEVLYLPLPRKHSPDGTSPDRLRTSNCSLLLIYLPLKDERLSRPGWLTYSGRFTHISGHPPAACRAQDRESSPVKDRRSTNCATDVTKLFVLKILFCVLFVPSLWRITFSASASSSDKELHGARPLVKAYATCTPIWQFFFGRKPTF